MKKTIITFILLLPFALFLVGQTQKPKAATPQASLQASLTRGKAVYAKSCIACHQADGNGVPRLNPPLTKSPFVNGDKNRLIKIVLKGLDEEIEIDGEFYSNPMPPQAYLTDQEIADVLTYVRNNFQNKAAAVTTAQVKALRATTK